MENSIEIAKQKIAKAENELLEYICTKHYLYEKAAEYTDVLDRLHDLMGRYNVANVLKISIKFDSGLKELDLTEYTCDMHKLEIVKQIAGTIAGDLRDIEKQIKQQIDGN